MSESMFDVKKSVFIDEYFGMQPFLKKQTGVVYARVGGHAFWPARVCDLPEYLHMVPHRQKTQQVCVYFFGAKNFGWVFKSNILPFSLTPPVAKGSKNKTKTSTYKAGLDEAKQLWDSGETDMWERLEKQNEEWTETKYKCDGCHKSDSNRTVVQCSSDKCMSQYHAECTEIGEADKWSCPKCVDEEPIIAPVVEDEVEKKAPAKKKASGNKKTTPESPMKEEEVDDSDERCLICGYGGELIMCDFKHCTKVYHLPCLGSYPFSLSDEKWMCPQHTCAVTGVKDVPSTRTPQRNSTSGAPSPVIAGSSTLWKCACCPVAVANDFVPNSLFKRLKHRQPSEAATLFSQKRKSFICPNCCNPTPRLEFVKLVERIWATVATHPQSLPFISPLLPGVSGSTTFDRSQSNLLHIVNRLRRMQLLSVSELESSMHQIVADAKTLVNGRSKPLDEAADTMIMILDEQLKVFRVALTAAHEKMQKSSDDGGTTLFPGWPIEWRKELMPFQNTNYVEVEPKTLQEWNDYIMNPPKTVRSIPSGTTTASAETNSTEPNGLRIDTDIDALSSDEKYDIARAISSLRDLPAAQSAAKDYFLSPSTSEMQSMFAQQSALLRKVLLGHSALQRAWKISQEKVLGGPEGEIITLGEGRLAGELRKSNENLRQRLANKDKLIDSLLEKQKETAKALEAATAKLAKSQKTQNGANQSKRQSSTSPTEAPSEKRRRNPSPRRIS